MKIVSNPLRLFTASAVLLLCGVTPTPGPLGASAQFGFSLAPGQTLTQYLTPGSSLTLAVFWNHTEDMELSALLDGKGLDYVGSITQANDSSQGNASYVLDGASLSVGRHTLDLTCKPSDSNITERMTVAVYNLHPVAGLSVSGLDSSGQMWALVNASSTITASVSSGSLLTAEWLINDTTLVIQNYTDGETALSYTTTWDAFATHFLTLIVSNDRSSINKSFTLHTLHPINGVSLRAARVSSEANQEVTMFLDFAGDMETEVGPVQYSLDWRDGSGVQTQLLNVTPGGVLNFTHTFTKQSKFGVSLTLTSKADSKSFSFEADIWDNLTDLDLSVVPLAGRPGDQFNLSMGNTPNETFRFVIDCGHGTPISNSKASYASDFVYPASSDMLCSYSAIGVYKVHMHAYNKRYVKNVTKTVIIEIPFSEADYALNPKQSVIPVPDGSIQFKASLKNPAASASGFCYWDFDVVNRTAQHVFLDSQNDFPVKETFQYTSPETYNVSFNCYNNISNMSVTSTIQTKAWSMSNFLVVVNNPQVMNGLNASVPALINITLMDIVRPPADLTVNFSYGDGSSPHGFTLTSWETYHQYSRRHIFSGRVTLSHPQKGTITRGFTVRQGAFQISYSPSGGIVETQAFTFKVQVPGPFTGDLVIDFGDGKSWTKTAISVTTPTNFTAPHSYLQVGDYSPSITGTSKTINNTYVESSKFSEVMIDVEGQVSDLKITVSPPKVLYPPGDIVATVKLARTKHRLRKVMCYVNFNEVLDPEPRTWTGGLQPGQSFQMPFSFLTLGSKPITANCSDRYSDQNIETYALTFNPCFSDDPIFDRQYGYYKTAMVVLNSMVLRLVTRTFILCPKTVPEFRWWVFEHSLSGQRLREVRGLRQPHADFIGLPAGALEPGLYKLTLNISFGPEQNFVWMQESTYVRIIRTPLVAQITGGTQRLTGNPNALIDGQTFSYDPVKGVDDKAGIEFLWECQLLNTTSMEELVQLSSTPFRGNFTSDCNDISSHVQPGIRRLVVSPGLSVAGYLFKLRIKKGSDVSPPSHLYIQYDQTSFNVEVKCVVNCDLKVAVSSPMRLETVCESCTDAQMLDSEYTWNVTLWDNATGQFRAMDDINSYFENSGFDTGPAINIPEGKLLGCVRYRIFGRMILPTGRDGIAYYEFLTNCKPTGGTCDVTPKAGNVMEQKFTLTCSGWTDDGFADPTNRTEVSDSYADLAEASSSLYYRFFLQKNNIRVPIAEGGESNMPRLELPLIVGQEGEDYELVARIYDTLQDYAEVSIPVLLNMTNIEDYDAVSERTEFWNDQMYYTNSSSTLEKQLRSVSTMSSLMASFPIPDLRSPLLKAASSNTSAVVREGWDSMWHGLYNPAPNPVQSNLTQLTQQFSAMIRARNKESQELSGMGVAALGEGIAAILFSSQVADTESLLASSDVAESGSEAVRRLFTTKPYPIGAKLNEAVFSMAALLDRVLAICVPTYDLSIGSNIVINATGVGEDEGRFMVSRVKQAEAVQEREKINRTQAAMPKLTRTIHTLLESLLAQQVLGQPPTTVQRGGVALAASKVSGRTLAKANFSVSDFDLNLDSLDEDGGDSDPDKVVDVRATALDKNPYAWSKDGSSYEITSPVVRVNLTDRKGQRKLRKLQMRLKRGKGNPVPEMETYSSDATRGGPHGWWYHHFSLRSGSASVVTFFTLPTGLSRAVAYFRTDRWPTKDRYEVRKEGVIVSEATVSRRRRSVPSGGHNGTASGNGSAANTPPSGPTVKFFVPPGFLSPGRAFVGFHLPELGDDNNQTHHYRYMGFTDTCRVWDDNAETWDPSACMVSDQSNAQETVCSCQNPPGMTFATSFFVAPTTIDFATVFAKFDITNAAVYGTLIGIGVVWVLALLWARRKDKRDKERWLVGYLRDNLADDGYFYLLTVHTGIRRGAGTLSRVSFILTGDRGDTGVRVLSDGKRVLETGSVMCYILATTQPLGDLRHLRIWHDDSGPFGRSSWYLSRMTAEDLQTGERFNFICEKWLSLDRDEGLIDRFVPVTLKDEVMTFDKLFAEHARVGVTDTHLWLSCFLRPERSAFSRVQRVSCCVALLLLTMITSAMFYKPEDSETGESTSKLGMEVTIGIMKFSMATLWTSMVSIVITTIPTLLFVALFRSSRPRWGPRAQALRQRRQGLLQMTKASKLLSDRKRKNGESAEDQNVSDLLDDALQENPLPHACVYVTWLLLLGTLAACSFFLLLYSMQWGKTTSQEWLAAFFLAFFESVLVVDPVKVLLLAVLLAYCAGNPYFSTQHQHVDMHRLHTEAETFGSDQIDPTAVPPDPIPDTVLEAARKRREQEQLAQRVFFELLLYIFYVFCVFVESYGHRDQNTYLVNSHLDSLFYAPDGDAPVPFANISRRQDVMSFLNTTLKNSAFPWTDLTGRELHWKLRYFASDLTSFRVGPVRVRQVRMPARETYPKVTRMYPTLSVNQGSFPPYKMEAEETGTFCPGWAGRACTAEELRTSLTLPSWGYRDNGTQAPVWGIFAFYPSGGYLVDLVINRDVVSRMIEELHRHRWLDLQTKAVFVELALYNPNINLFTFLRMAAEFPEVGSTFVWKDFKTLRIYNHVGALGGFILICEIVLLIVLLIFTVKFVRGVKRQRLRYFGDFWQMLDFISLVISYIAIVFYVMKSLKISDVMAQWRYDPKVYVDFYLPIMYDDVYGFILAGLVFVVSIRLLRILGYNQRVTMIATVLARSGRDLFGFSVVFFIVLTAYMMTGLILFAASMYQFRSVWDSYCTLYLVLLGKNVLGRFIGEAPLWAQAYYCSLTILVIFILYTMFQAILCNTTSLVRSDIGTVPPPYGLVNVLHRFYTAAVADWVPSWFVRTPKTVAPTNQAPAAGLKPGYLSYPLIHPGSPQQQDVRTQPHRVLATLADHFNRFYQAEEKRAARRKKKMAFTSLNKDKTAANKESRI